MPPGKSLSGAILLAATAAFSVQPAQAAKPEWLVAQSAHFELYTTAGEGRARALLRHFETVHSFFGELLPAWQARRPVRIVVFSGRKEYAPFRPNEHAVAYYQARADLDYIVMQEGLEEFYPVAIHEYVHLIFNQPGLSVPAWLDEGLAEFYSTLAPRGGKVMLGAIKQDRLFHMSTAQWIPVEQVLRADHQSPLYNNKDHAGAFYAEAWLLTHMMMLEDDWRAKLPGFLDAVLRGADCVEAIQKHFGRSPRTLNRELQGYMNSFTFRAAVVNHTLEKYREKVDVRSAGEFDWRLVTASLLQDKTECKAQLEQLRLAFASRPEPPAALGYLALAGGRQDEARLMLGEAVMLGSRNPRLLWDYTRMAAQRDAGKATVAAQRLTEIEPANVEARIHLARLHATAGETAKAYTALGGAKAVRPAQAGEFFELLAFLAVKKGDLDEARKALRKVIEYAPEEAKKLNARRMLARLDAAPATRQPPSQAAAWPPLPPAIRRPPLAPATPQELPGVDAPDELVWAEGKFRQLICAGGTAWIVLQTGTTKMTFLVDQPTKVVIEGRSSGTLDLSCGAQAGETLVVGYLTAGSGLNEGDGLVRHLRWKTAAPQR